MIEDVGLVTDYLDLDEQVQPNGFDLTLHSVEHLRHPGELTPWNKTLSRTIPVEPKLKTYRLRPGPYFVRFNETVHLPVDVMAFGRPRSTLLRCGVAFHTAVWDAGYIGQSGSLLHVLNQDGFIVQKDSRVLQLVFCTLTTAVANAYAGSYQYEGVSTPPA